MQRRNITIVIFIALIIGLSATVMKQWKAQQKPPPVQQQRAFPVSRPARPQEIKAAKAVIDKQLALFRKGDYAHGFAAQLFGGSRPDQVPALVRAYPQMRSYKSIEYGKPQVTDRNTFMDVTLVSKIGTRTKLEYNLIPMGADFGIFTFTPVDIFLDGDGWNRPAGSGAAKPVARPPMYGSPGLTPPGLRR